VFKLSSQTALPPNLENRLELIADPIVRVGQSTDSTLFPEPRFSALRVSQNRRTISFRVCLDPRNQLPAGKYVGTIDVEGPLGIESTPITVTANAKDGGVFWASATLALLFAFVILLYKGASEERTRRIAETEKLDDADADAITARRAAIAEASKMSTSSRTARRARKAALAEAARMPGGKQEAQLYAQSFRYAAWATFKQPAWLVGTVFAVGGAFGALWGIYDASPSWGEAGPVTSGFSIIGAALAAIGAKTIISGAK
jgi:hypothetical protein